MANFWENDPIVDQSAKAAPINFWEKDSIVEKPKPDELGRFIAQPGQAQPAAAPTPQQPESFSTLRQAADIPLKATEGLVSGIRMISDAFGANNAVSQSLSGAEDYLANLMSAQAKNDKQEVARIMKEAEDKGALEQVKAGIKAFGVAPVGLLANALGTSAPIIIGALGAEVLGPAAMVTTGVGLGSTMGAGTVKGSIYQTVKDELSKTKMPADQVEARAQLAQNYNGKNLDLILGGAALGSLDAVTGLEASAIRQLAGKISKDVAKEEAKKIAEQQVQQAAQKGIKKQAAITGAEEFGTEFAQSAEENTAQNIALQREGIDTPTFKGVLGQATLEGLAGLGLGTVAGGREAMHAKDLLAQREAQKAAEEEQNKKEQQQTTPPPPEQKVAIDKDVDSLLSSHLDQTVTKQAEETFDVATTNEQIDALQKQVDERQAKLDAGNHPNPKAAEKKQAKDKQKLEELKTQQGELNVPISPINGTDRSSAEVLGQQTDSTTATGTTTVGDQGLGRVTPPANLSQTGKESERTALDEKTQAALEQQAAEAEAVPDLSVAALQKKAGIVPKGKKKAAAAVPTDYLNSRTFYGDKSPNELVNERTADPENKLDTDPTNIGISNAGHEEAFDAYDKVDIKNGVAPELQAIADERNKEQQIKRQQMRQELSGKIDPETDKKYNQEKIKRIVSNIPIYKAGAPLDFLTEDELVDIYKKHADKRDFVKEERTTRTNQQQTRAQFVEGLEELQKAKVQTIAQRSFADEVVSNARRKTQTTTADKRKARADKLSKTADELSQEIAEIEKAKVAQQEDTAKTAAEKEVAEEKDLETTAKEVSEAAEKVLPKKEAKTTEQKAPAVSKLHKAITEDIKANNILSAIENISDSSLNGRGTRTNAKVFTQLIKLFGGIDKNNLTIKFGPVEKGNPGKFDPANNTITILGSNEEGYTGARPLDEVVMHEVGHYLNDHVIDNRKKYLASIKNAADRKAIENALNRLNNNYSYVKGKLGDKYNIPTIKEFIAEFWGNSAFQADLRTMDIEKEGQYVSVGPIRTYKTKEENRTLFEKIIANVADALGLGRFNKPDEAVIYKELLEDLGRIAAMPSEFAGKRVSYSAAAPKKAPPYLEVNSVYDNNPAFALPAKLQKARFTDVIKNIFTHEGIQTAISKFQNNRQRVKYLEDRKTKAELTIDYGPDVNNLYTQITLAPVRAMNKYHGEVQATKEQLEQGIVDFANTQEIIDATKKANEARRKVDPKHIDRTPIEFAQEVLGIYGQAFTDVERRHNMFVQTAPLSTTKNIKLNGKMISAADLREMIIGNPITQKAGILSTNQKLTEAQARQLWERLEQYVFTTDAKGNKVPNTKYVVASGFSPEGRKALDFRTNEGNAEYNATGFTYQETEKILNEYANDKNKATLDKIFESVWKLNDTAKDLNKESYYVSKPAANWITAYGYKHYVPLKGITNHTLAQQRSALNFNGKTLEKDLVDTAIRAEGRFTVSNNPVLQSMSEAMVAAMRAGKGPEFTLSIKNLLGKGINGKVVETIPFNERSFDKIKEARKQNTVFHHNEDGSIDVIEINDDKMLESIRRSYKDQNQFVEMANFITSTLGQVHTRYNYNFAPLNFVRDALTNAWNIGAKLGPVEGAKLITRMATQVTTKNALGKAWEVARAYKTPNFEQFANSNDPIIKNMYELIKRGGMVEYMEGISLKSNLEKLNLLAGKNRIIKSKEGLDTLLDVWTNMFELASRSAAYGVLKDNYMKELKLDKEAASIRAASDTLNLANFSQVGEYGKVMGALYMFFRPSATGAVRALESLAPALYGSLDRAVKNLPEHIANDPTAKAKFIENYKKEQHNSRLMVTALTAAGALAYTMSYMSADTDDLNRNKVLTDDMGQWTRFWRLYVPGQDKPYQVPWGFGLGAFAAMGAQLAAAMSGQQSVGAALKNGVTQIGLDSFIPIPVSRMDATQDPAGWFVDSVSPSFFRPIVEFWANKNGLGQNIYNDATGRRMGDAYLGGDHVPETYKATARWVAETFGYDWSPNSIYFLVNSYADGPARLIDTTVNDYYLATGGKQFEPKTDIPLIGSFIGAAPSVDTREFTSVENQIDKMRQKVNEFKKFNPQYYYGEYLSDHPLDEVIVKTYDHNISNLNKLRAQSKLIIGGDYDMATRKDLLEANRMQQNLIKHNLVEMFKAYDIKP